VMYSKGSSYIDRGFLQTTDDKEGERHYLTPRRTEPQDQIAIYLLDGMIRSLLSGYYSSRGRASRGVWVAHLRQFEGSS